MTFPNSVVVLGFAAAAALVAASHANADPKLTETVVTYEVTGATPAEVRANIDKIGPFGETEKRRVHALTKWVVRWGFMAADGPAGCDVAGVVTFVDATITMPKLKTNAATTPKLVQAFSDYSEKLMVHERGHVQNGVEVAKLIEAALSKLPKAATCAELMRAADPIGLKIIKEDGARLDAEYDARTRHGVLQGVKFP